MSSMSGNRSAGAKTRISRVEVRGMNRIAPGVAFLRLRLPRLPLRVRGEADDLIKVIGKVKGINNVQSKEEGVLEFQFAPGQDVRAEVARATVNAGYDLLEMRPIGMSLEDIFLQLTREENVEMEA